MLSCLSNVQTFEIVLTITKKVPLPLRFSRQKYTEELLKGKKKKKEKNLNDPDNHDGVITHLEPDIL